MTDKLGAYRETLTVFDPTRKAIQAKRDEAHADIKSANDDITRANTILALLAEIERALPPDDPAAAAASPPAVKRRPRGPNKPKLTETEKLARAHTLRAAQDGGLIDVGRAIGSVVIPAPKIGEGGMMPQRDPASGVSRYGTGVSGQLNAADVSTPMGAGDTAPDGERR